MRPSAARAARYAPRTTNAKAEESFSRPEPSPYPGKCDACEGWYHRGTPTRWHFTSDGQAHREHAQCSQSPQTTTTPTHQYEPATTRKPAQLRLGV